MAAETIRTRDSVTPTIVRAHAPIAGAEHPWGTGHALRDAQNPLHWAEDLRLLRAGILDDASFAAGYQRHKDPVRLVVRDRAGRLKAVRHTANLRPNIGTAWEAYALLGGPDTSLAATVAGTIAYTATAVTPGTSPVWTAHQWIGHYAAAAGVYGVVTENTAADLTLDQWYAPGGAGAAGSTPANDTPLLILPGQAPMRWLALTDDSTETLDTTVTALTAEVTTNGLARAFATLAFTAPTTTATSTNQGTLSVAHTFTATGAQAVQRCALFNAKVNGTPGFIAPFTLVTLAVGDTVAVGWTLSV